MANIRINYGNYTFQPVPNVQFSTEIKRSDAGYMIGTVDKIVLNGLLFGSGEINNTGVTTSNNSFNNVLLKFSGLKNAVEKDYETFEIMCSGEGAATASNIYKSDKNVTFVDNFEFTNSSNNTWLQIIDYSISLSVYQTGTLNKKLINYISDSGYLVSNFVDSYTINTNDENYYNFLNTHIPKFGSTVGLTLPSYTITRNVSANGIETKNTKALDNAKRFVSGLLNSNQHGFDKMLSGLFIYDRSTEINQDPINGTYGINDTFVAYSGSSGWIDTYTITNTFDSNLKRTVEIAGEVKGFDRYDSNNSFLYNKLLDNTFANTSGSLQGYASTKWSSASGGFYTHVAPNILNKIRGSWTSNTGVYRNILPPSGKYHINSAINPIPLSVSINHNLPQGSISYNYTYNSRPLNYILEAISETLDIDDSYSLRTYVFPEVFNRLPIAQDMGTYSNSQRSLSYSATFPRPFSPNTTQDITRKVKDFVNKFSPTVLTPLTSLPGRGPGFFAWVIANSENYDIITGKYSYNITWEYQKAYMPSPINQPTRFTP